MNRIHKTLVKCQKFQSTFTWARGVTTWTTEKCASKVKLYRTKRQISPRASQYPFCSSVCVIKLLNAVKWLRWLNVLWKQLNKLIITLPLFSVDLSWILLIYLMYAIALAKQQNRQIGNRKEIQFSAVSGFWMFHLVPFFAALCYVVWSRWQFQRLNLLLWRFFCLVQYYQRLPGITRVSPSIKPIKPNQWN